MTRPEMRRRASRLLVGVLAVAPLGLGLPSDAGAQVADTGRVDIQGRVLDGFTREPLWGVTVALPEFSVLIRTDSTGLFELKGIPLGTYELTLSMPGYRTASGGFAVLRSGSFITTLTPLYVAEEDVTAGTGHFVGRVVDGESGQPVAGADVRVQGLYLGGMTDEEGRFSVAQVPVGRHAVEFSQLGYATRTDTILFAAGQTSDARVRLSRDPIEIEPIEVTVERREIALQNVGFYDRREQGFGEFIDIEIIERRRPEFLTDVFTGMVGVELVPSAFNALERHVVLRGGRNSRFMGDGYCYPMVVVDGLVVHRGGNDPAVIDNLVDPQAVAGIEVYPSQAGVTAQYSGIDAACGVIVVWTRR